MQMPETSMLNLAVLAVRADFYKIAFLRLQ